MIIFQAGFFVGYHKASFINNWDNRYLGNSKYPRSAYSPFMMMRRGDEINPHGALGQIISINLPKLMVKGPNRAEITASINSDTSIRRMREEASSSDLTIGQNVIIIGEPSNDGEIDAKLIRILPTTNFSPKPKESPIKY